MRLPTMTCWNSGTGRCSSTIVVVSPRTVSSHSPNSSALDTVADSDTSGHRLGEVDDDLLPHRATHPVREVVDLVHDDEAQTREGSRAGVQHVPQHLGGHHHDRRLAVDAVVTGQQADPVRTVAAHEVGVLLVGQGLDRGRVEALPFGPERQVYGELADHRLPGAGGGSHQHAAAILELTAGPELEVVEREVVEAGEVPQDRMLSTRAVGGVLLRGRGSVRFMR